MTVLSKPDRSIAYRTQVIIAFAALYLIWGSTYLAIRFTIETLPPLLSAGLRFLLAGLILYAFARYRKKESAPQLRHWKAAFIIGGFLLLGGNGCVVWAERYVPSGLAALFLAITPLWMVLLEWWWHETERPSIGVFLGIGIGVFGVWLLIKPGGIHWGGALLLLFASFSWSIGSVYSRRADLPKSSYLPTAMQMIGGGVLLFMMGLFQGEYKHSNIINFSSKSMVAWAYLIMVGSLLGYTAYLWLLKNVGIARASTYAYVNPVVAIFLGWLMAGEKLDSQSSIASVFVLVAVIIITIYHREGNVILSEAKDLKGS